MKSPFTGKEMCTHKEWRTLSFRKEEFKVLSHMYICKETGEKFEDDAFANLNYNQLVNQYREKFSIPFPEQIKSIRKKYGVSAVKMSEILGFGVNSYRQYEAGEIPSQSNAKLIQLVSDPHEFEKLVKLCSTLNHSIKIKLQQKIDSLIQNQKDHKLEIQLEKYFLGECLPGSLTGYKLSNLLRFTEMVVFFTEKLQPWKTKLNKLLFYADFYMFSQTGFSISGVQYRAIPMGPVPNNFNSIFEFLANNNDIDIYCSLFPDGGTGEQFRQNKKRKFNADLFSEKELDVLQIIATRFRDTSTNEIIEISHKENAWIQNEKKKQIIDYKYSFDLN